MVDLMIYGWFNC